MRKWQATLYAILITGSLVATERAAESRKARGSKASADATRLIEEGSEALRKQDYPGARRALEQALRAAAGPEVLFQLGRLAVAEGRLAAAQDLMRRFLHDSSGEAEGPLQKEARAILTQPAGAQGEVAVLGARGAVVLVDERPVGSLPLALPLLLPLGPHRVTVELGAQRVEEQVKVLPGQLAEMRFNLARGSELRRCWAGAGERVQPLRNTSSGAWSRRDHTDTSDEATPRATPTGRSFSALDGSASMKG